MVVVRRPGQVVDQVPITATGAPHKYCVRSSGGALAVTLAWADFPCSPSAAKCLINDLDLTVQVAPIPFSPPVNIHIVLVARATVCACCACHRPSQRQLPGACWLVLDSFLALCRVGHASRSGNLGFLSIRVGWALAHF